MPDLKTQLRQFNLNGTTISAVIAVIIVGSVVVTGWWRLEAQIDSQIARQQAPLAEKVEEVKDSVDDLKRDMSQLNRQQGEIVGELKHISRGLGLEPRLSGQ